ncbi:MAG: hypothetical protein HY340_01075 [Candidatus Kerfeldbacteria bacterium]|nr:hypothetical protein [Candidatus Kerfeldbacteria bacterium]
MDFAWWGWNLRTVSFSGTFVFTALQGWGLVKQSDAIWNGRSGASVSNPWFIFNTALFTTFFLYGLTRLDLPIIANGGALAVLHIPILLGLARFKGITRPQRQFGFGLGIVVAAAGIVRLLGVVYLIGCFVAIAFYALQAAEIVKNKSRGVISIKLLGSYLASTVFWTVYAYMSNDWVLKIVAPMFLSVLVVMIVLWLRYPRPALTLVRSSERVRTNGRRLPSSR